MTATRLYSALPGCVTSGCFPRRCRGAQTDSPYISDAPGRDEANAIGCVPGTRAHRSVHSVPHSVCGRPMTQMRNDCGNLYATPAGLPSPPGAPPPPSANAFLERSSAKRRGFSSSSLRIIQCMQEAAWHDVPPGRTGSA
ncbi:hypothetical protein MTO96_011231 [Rhipicephalus appendiculatus]